MKMKTGVLTHVTIIGVCLVVAACSLTGLQGNQNDNGSSTDPSLKLVAQANAGTLTTEVSYAETDVESKFEINVSGGVPGSEIDVVVNGIVVATIVLDDAGSAHVEYSSIPDDSGGLLLPDTFVPPQAGDIVAVGELQSEFRDDSSDDDDNSNDNGNDNDDDDDSDDDENDNEDDDSDDNGNDNSNDNDDDGTVGNDNSDDNLNENANNNDNADDSANDNSDDSGNDNVDDDLDNTNSNDNVDDDSGNDNTSANDNTH